MLPLYMWKFSWIIFTLHKPLSVSHKNIVSDNILFPIVGVDAIIFRAVTGLNRCIK